MTLYLDIIGEFLTKRIIRSGTTLLVGRDAIASYYSYYNKLERKCSFGDLIIDGNHLSYSKWHEHTRAWINNPYGAEILILKYEDLIENPYLQLDRVLKFIGLERPMKF